MGEKEIVKDDEEIIGKEKLVRRDGEKRGDRKKEKNRDDNSAWERMISRGLK